MNADVSPGAPPTAPTAPTTHCKENDMDLCLPRDFFRPRRGVRLFRDDLGPARDSPASRLDPRRCFVTGLHDWRHPPAISPRHPAHVADSDWHPL